MLLQNSVRSFWLPLGAALLWLTPPASAVTIDWVPIGNPGNAADSTGYGAVGSAYNIDRYEVTNAQYVEFLTAKAASIPDPFDPNPDPLGLYNPNMGSGTGGITQACLVTSCTYSVILGRGNMPVNFVSFYDTLRFANWMHNGQGVGSTETGAYTLDGGTPTPSNGATVTRNPGATIFLTSEDEWYKAAYHSTGSTYFDYPAGSDTATACTAAPGTGNNANCNSAVGNLTAVGSYTGGTLSDSPYGTFDQGGNVWEWNEAIFTSGAFRGQRGGAYSFVPGNLEASIQRLGTPTDEVDFVGFRVAMVPEPGTGLLMMMGLLGLASWGRRRA